MYNALVYILSFVFVLGVLIFVHELGHFLAAKYFKVRVLTFSLGFGKRLVGFQRGGTDYRISVLPVGGYVRMAGEYPTDESVGAPDEFLNKPRWQRLIVGVAGAAMNLITAVFILSAVFRFNYMEPVYLRQPLVVGTVTANSAASEAGLEAGDRITELNAKGNPNWHDLEMLSITNLGAPVAVTVERNGRQFGLTVTPRLVTLPETGERISDFGIQPTLAVQVRNLVPGFPAANAGVQDGDLILKIGDHPITKTDDFSYLNDTIHKSVGKPLLFVLKRGNDIFTMEITPVLDPALGYGRIGFRPDIPTEKMNLGVLGSVRRSVGENVRIAGLTFKVLGQLVTGKTSPKTLVGPIGIFKVTGEAAKTSASDLFHWMSFISLQLGIFNLLPIPVLDGGMIFVLLIESAIRRDLSRIAKERLIQVGFVFLMLLMVYVIYNDAMRYTPWVKSSGSTTPQTAAPAK
ncbi:MAG: RIP metalloprotease RseP [Acidobacteriia bacterium]|nr:RIP metalloprotease RseP [Terriglobia bacterium]